MGVLRHLRRRRKHHHWLPTLTTFTFLLFSSASAITILASQPSSGAVMKHYPQKEEKENGSPAAPLAQKRLAGPGSSPPSCRSKCGWCSPCQPVHVPVQPGLIIRLEYYPEAWRCKCGNKLFMP
ncbi:Epidermal patterning factor protein [Sesbania bispinosa]|nr:Epidermal patterning factor protein [Sesbania bispinosa]